MRPTRDDGMLTTPQAARMLGVSPATIRSWRNRGWLKRQGLDEHGYPLHTPEALRAAEKRVTGNGITATGINPRQLRGRARRQEEAAA
jgi:DNA-binding transcriptional MerR regulator